MRLSDNSRKTSIVGTIVASVCILVYLGALVSAIVGISASMDQRRARASREFQALADRASAAGAAGFMDDAYMETIQRALNESGVLEGVIISGPGVALGFERERGHAITWVNGSPRFRNRFDFSRQDLFEPLRIPGWNVTIHAVAGAFDFSEVAGSLKRAMIMIAAALAVAFFALLAESAALRKRAEADSGEPAFAQEPRLKTRRRSADIGEGMETGAKAESPPHAPRKHGEYSERGRVIKREHTEERLAEEIERSAAAGQDIAFIAVEFKTSRADNYYARLAADAARFFSSKEFICERGERGLSIICPGLTLEVGLLNASEFHSRVIGKYPGAFKHKTDLCMGISARSGREPITAARLVFEAEEALERSLMDPVSHVVAFKIDPDRYRAFMEGRRGSV